MESVEIIGHLPPLVMQTVKMSQMLFVLVCKDSLFVRGVLWKA